jgi:hypothetical protein
MSTATGVAREIMMAKELDAPVFGVCVDGTEVSGLLPPALLRDRTVAWGWSAIAAAVEQAMDEEQTAQ